MLRAVDPLQYTGAALLKCHLHSYSMPWLEKPTWQSVDKLVKSSRVGGPTPQEDPHWVRAAGNNLHVEILEKGKAQARSRQVGWGSG